MESACILMVYYTRIFTTEKKLVSPDALTMDTQRELFFKNPKILGLGRHFGLQFFEAFMVFSTKLSAPILLLFVPCPKYLFGVPNIYLGLGFKAGVSEEILK